MSVTPQEADRQLHEFMHTHRQVMQKFFSGCGMFNGHPFMLFCIRRSPGITPAKLAQEMDIAPASATISLKRMETAGLLRREPDARDRRVVHLSLTPKGEALDDLCRRGKDFTTETLFAGFSPEELTALSSMLGRMRDNLDAADAQRWLELHRHERDDRE